MPLNNLPYAEQAEFLRLIIDSTAEGFYSVDPEGKTTLCNKAFLNMLGYASADEVLGLKLHGVIHHSHPDGSVYHVIDCPIYQAAGGSSEAHITYELFFRKDGTSFPVEYRAKPIFQNGEPRGAICTFIDITDRIEKEKGLREAQDFASSIVENSTDCVKVLDLNGKLLSMNQSGCMQMEIDDIALCINETWTEFWHAEYRQRANQCLEEAKAGRVGRFEGLGNTMKGTPKWWEVIVTPLRSSDGSVMKILCVSRDITDRRNTQENVSQLQEHLSLMVESAQDYAIISIDSKGAIVIWNTGAEHIFGYTPEQAIGQDFALIFTPEDRLHGAPEKELKTAVEKGRASDERWHLRENGQRFYASGIVAAMYGQDNQIKGFIKIARDMTADQKAQEALREARNAAEAANIAKTEFLANMSHEIRTPMNAIIGLSNILAISQPLTQKQKDFIKTLQMSADSLLSLINDLLDIAKIEARTVDLEQIPFSIERIIQEVISMMAVRVKEKGLTFTSDHACIENRMFIGDPTRLRQIILNLCSNAIKFTDNGNVHVSIRCHSAMDDEEQIRIAIKDSGIGIASDKLETIFHKFVQADTSINRKYGGTGLGLAITKTLVEIMGGVIEVKSAPGEGSVFEVRIPLKIASNIISAEADYSITSVAAHSVEMHMRPNILLVEDYEPNILVASTFLEQFGYRVDVATNGLDAFEKIKLNQYIAVLMDVQMHGINGFETTKLIREYEQMNTSARLPIIGMTAHALAGDRERCISSGMDDYISKPFNPDELQHKIKTLAILDE